MSFDVYLPLIAAAVFGTLGVRLARRLPPAQATWLLTCGSVITSACSLCSLALLACTLIAQINVVASAGDWSAALIHRDDPVSLAVAASALTVLAVVVIRAGRALMRHTKSLTDAYRTCRHLPAAVGELVVVSDDSFGARALPGRPGRIVVSQRTLASLSPVERSAVFSHERAHLRHRHHLFQTAVALAAAANPLLRAVPAATSLAVERWADEDAALRLGGRTPIESALCTVIGGQIRPLSTPASRITALRRPVQRSNWFAFVGVAVSAVALLLVLGVSAEATSDADQLLHRADTPTAVSAPHAHHTHMSEVGFQSPPSRTANRS